MGKLIELPATNNGSPKRTTTDSGSTEFLEDPEDDEYTHAATFLAVVGGWGQAPGAGNYTYVKFFVPGEHKYTAMPLTDLPAVLLRVTVEVPTDAL